MAQFPKDFVWGASTCAYQIEGAAQEDGRGETIWDRFSHTPGRIKDGSNGDVACDHYHRYRDDVKLMRQLNHNGYRGSIAWARIFPTGSGAPNPAGVDFYKRLVDSLLEAGITPFFTLYHWDLPQVLQDQGGWANRETALRFVDYARYITGQLGDRVKHWITHNEPWCTTFLSTYLDIHAPGGKDLKLTLQNAHHVLLSHGLTVPAIREVVPGAVIGMAPNYVPAYAVTDNPKDVAAAHRFDGFFNRWFIDPLAGRGYPPDMWEYYGANVPQITPGDMDIIAAPLDFLGLNYYDRAYVVDDPTSTHVPHTRGVPSSQEWRTADRDVYPDGLYDMLRRVYLDYNFPALYITENGAAFSDEISADGAVHDADRVEFLQAHFNQAARAIDTGIPLKGYFVWSLLDNFEWSQGYTLRYGITYIDYATQRRIVKDSGLWYRDFISQNRA
ncbi:MAG: beta-glucosidase [Chloroflexi bacterium]|nr:beta-glucosidase [Chloroflexota bacterium]